jgi:hypothetical protein
MYILPAQDLYKGPCLSWRLNEQFPFLMQGLLGTDPMLESRTVGTAISLPE